MRRPQDRLRWWLPLLGLVAAYWVALGAWLFGRQVVAAACDAVRYMMGG